MMNIAMYMRQHSVNGGGYYMCVYKLLLILRIYSYIQIQRGRAQWSLPSEG